MFFVQTWTMLGSCGARCVRRDTALVVAETCKNTVELNADCDDSSNLSAKVGSELGKLMREQQIKKVRIVQVETCRREKS